MSGSQQQNLLRPPSPAVTRSEANSSIQVHDASSNRARSSDRSPRRRVMELSSSSRYRPPAPIQEQPLQSKSSMSQDLAGLIDETASTTEALGATLRGNKRMRDDTSADEPAPKRDRLQLELEEMEAMHRRESSGDEGSISSPGLVDPQHQQQQHQQRQDDAAPANRGQGIPIRSPGRSSRSQSARESTQGEDGSRSSRSPSNYKLS